MVLDYNNFTGTIEKDKIKLKLNTFSNKYDNNDGDKISDTPYKITIGGEEFAIKDEIIIQEIINENGNKITNFSNLPDGKYTCEFNYYTTPNGHNWDYIFYNKAEFDITLKNNTFSGTITLSGKKYTEEFEWAKEKDEDGNEKYITKEYTEKISGKIINEDIELENVIANIEGRYVDEKAIGRAVTASDYSTIYEHYMNWNVRKFSQGSNYANRLTMYFK